MTLDLTKPLQTIAEKFPVTLGGLSPDKRKVHVWVDYGNSEWVGFSYDVTQLADYVENAQPLRIVGGKFYRDNIGDIWWIAHKIPVELTLTDGKYRYCGLTNKGTFCQFSEDGNTVLGKIRLVCQSNQEMFHKIT